MHHKLLEINHIDVKFDSEKQGVFSGYASVFDGVDAYGDTIIKGAYLNTIKARQRPIQMRWNHYGEVIGKWTKIEEDEKGLFVEGELTPNHSKAQDVYALLKHGAISGMSIGYRVVKGVPNGNDGLDLYEIDLIEISIVESPADLGAQIADIKNDIVELKTLKQIEAYLRDAHRFSRSEATALVSHIKAVAHGEHEAEEKTNKNSEIAKMIAEHTSQILKRI